MWGRELAAAHGLAQVRLRAGLPAGAAGDHPTGVMSWQQPRTAGRLKWGFVPAGKTCTLNHSTYTRATRRCHAGASVVRYQGAATCAGATRAASCAVGL